MVKTPLPRSCWAQHPRHAQPGKPALLWGCVTPVIQQQQGALASDSLALLTSGVTAAVEEAFTSLGEIN